MASQEDNVVPMPTALERLASRAAQAMADYKAGGHRTIQAVITYGEALLEGRALHSSDNAFSQWVSDNRLDQGKPWDHRPERSCAMRLVEVLRGSGNAPTTAFADCPVTRPVDIMKWYRRTVLHEEPHKRAPRAPSAKMQRALDELAKMAAENEPITSPALAKRAGVGETTAWKVVHAFLKDRPAPEPEPSREPEPEPPPLTAFTEKGKVRIEDAIRIHQERLSKQFAARVYDEVRRRIELADDAVRNSLKELRSKCDRLERMLQQKGIFTRAEFRQLQMAVHPDNTASTEVRNRLLDLLVKNETRLLKEP